MESTARSNIWDEYRNELREKQKHVRYQLKNNNRKLIDMYWIYSYNSHFVSYSNGQPYRKYDDKFKRLFSRIYLDSKTS